MRLVGWVSWASSVFALVGAACGEDPPCPAGTRQLGSRCAEIRRDGGGLEDGASAVEEGEGAGDDDGGTEREPEEDAGEDTPGPEVGEEDAGTADPDSGEPAEPPPSPLLDLTVSAGSLKPAFSSAVTKYRIPVDITVQTVTLILTVPADASATIDGKPIDLEAGWTSDVLDLGDNSVAIVVSREGEPSSTYSLTVTRGFQQAYVKASNTGANDAFGTSVAIAGDFLVVGAPYEDSSAQGINGSQEDDATALDSGAAYVFQRTDGVWQQIQYLKATNTEAEDHFGASVAIYAGLLGSGRPGRIIVVGAPGEDGASVGADGDQSSNSAPDSGAAYVYGIGSGITYLKCGARAVDSGDACGASVAVWYDWIALGAPGEDGSTTGFSGTEGDNAAVDSGAVFLYRCGRDVQCRPNSEFYVKASNTGSKDHFGQSIAQSGIVPDGGKAPDSVTLVVGAPDEDGSATGVGGNESIDLVGSQDSGAAYVFSFGQARGQIAYVKANRIARDGFGAAVAVSGDWIVVGAPHESSSAVGVNGTGPNTSASSGAAYVYIKSGSTVSFSAYLKATNAGPQDLFGSSVSVSESTVLVGAPGEDSNARGVGGNQLDNSMSNAGAAYMYVSSGGTWAPQAYLKAQSPAAQDGFGTSVAISKGTVVIGATGEDKAAVGIDSTASPVGTADASGAMYVFR